MQMTQRNRQSDEMSGPNPSRNRYPNGRASGRGRPHPRTTTRAVVRGGAVTLTLLLAAACGSSKPSSPSSTSPSASASTSSSTGTTTSPSTSSSPSGSASGTAPADAAAAEAQIKQNWQKFFDPATSLDDKAKLLENGDTLKPVLQGFSADPRVGQITSQVSNVAFTSPTTATVTYSLSLQGAVVEQNATGKAVLQDGTWKVSLSTLCGLVALSGTTITIPGCS